MWLTLLALVTASQCLDFQHMYTLETGSGHWNKGLTRPIGPPLPLRLKPPAGKESSIVRVTRGTPEEEEECECVEYYLCDPKTNRVIEPEEEDDPTTGLRIQKKICPGVQVCCLKSLSPVKKPDDTGTPVQEPDDTNTPVQEPDDTNTPVKEPDDTNTPVKEPNDDSTHSVCGTQNQNIGDRIQNEQNVDTYFSEFPWMLALIRTVDEENIFLCGGSLIDYHIVLTAAHCVHKQNVSELQIRGGVWNLQEDDKAQPHQKRKVQNVIIHPNFKDGSLYHDVALLILDEPFSKTYTIGLICLPSADLQVDQNRCVTAGWGRDKFGSAGQYQNKFKKVELSVIPRDACEQKLRTTRLSEYFNLHDSFICAGGEMGKDACEGDGGGPLICSVNEDSNRYVQVGIVSWGIGCGQQGIPGVYANVIAESDWIMDNMPKRK